MTTNGDIVIVGAGEAGGRAATTLRESGFAGRLTLVGGETHGPYERPPLSKALMEAEDADVAPRTILTEQVLAEKRIDFLAGVRATNVDRAARRVMLEDGRQLGYQSLLLATGARSRPLPGSTGEQAGVLYLRTFADALNLRGRLRPGSRLVVIGGGFIGLEIAASAIKRGCAVTLLEMAPRILMRGVPASIAERVARKHVANGVDLRVGVAISGIDRAGDKSVVTLADGTHLECDAVLAGIGAVPETGLAEAAGLATDNGVRVDGTLRTEDPDIFAAGDCCSFPHPLYGGRRIRLEAWRNAQDQAVLAAANMLGGNEAYTAVPWFWSDQYDETLQVAGLPDEGVEVVTRDLDAGQLHFHLDAAGRLVAVSAISVDPAIAKDVRVAEMMIQRRATPKPEQLESRSVKLRSLLA